MAEPAARQRRPVRGFTLVEILVAFAILALTFAAVMQSMSGGLRILSVTEAHATAVRIAESRLAGAGSTAPLRPGTREGEEGRYRWRVAVSPYGEAPALEGTSLPPAYLVTATVTWGGSRSVRLSTVKFGEPESG